MLGADSRWNDGMMEKEKKKGLWPLVIDIIFVLKVFEPFGHKLWLVTICHHDMIYNYGLSYIMTLSHETLNLLYL